jgi:hypothetical protein
LRSRTRRLFWGLCRRRGFLSSARWAHVSPPVFYLRI